MTQQKALDEVARRWEGAAISKSKTKPKYFGQYQVGRLVPLPGFGKVFTIVGSGDSWEAAFADADKHPERATIL